MANSTIPLIYFALIIATTISILFVFPQTYNYTCSSCPNYYEMIVHVYAFGFLIALVSLWVKTIIMTVKMLGR